LEISTGYERLPQCPPALRKALRRPGYEGGAAGPTGLRSPGGFLVNLSLGDPGIKSDGPGPTTRAPP